MDRDVKGEVGGMGQIRQNPVKYDMQFEFQCQKATVYESGTCVSRETGLGRDSRNI